ncbi:N-6 DNA methylase [Pseudomonas plecoglossicida]|uniref:N-6 DNA methylase n=1 Tax=Pseudomonas plecoglossicida TaxID=70775 RepID=UPI0015E3026C|nr:N-6 DNA methylase [Pseudomonas plecoglossicida]MBA1322705.1 N-6 DNA methylase [Pseudomonas plecoglossicida]
MNFMINESAQKLRGGYYTPLDIASFISKWVLSKEHREILEPSCGDGVFLTAIGQHPYGSTANVTAFELNFLEATKAASAANKASVAADIINSDFLEWALDRITHNEPPKFDAIIGNPPFIRYQYLPEKFQLLSEAIFKALGCKFTKHTNAWVPFVLASLALLKPGGRMSMVLPSEIIHVLHAQSLRTQLNRECKKIVIIDPEEIWFEGTLQGAVILMIEKKVGNERSEGLGLVPVQGRNFLLEDPSTTFDNVKLISGSTIAAKWTKAFLSADILELLEKIERNVYVHSFKKIAKVDVGIVTGANKFFLVNDSTVEENRLENWAHPMFGRSEHCPGIIYDMHQHNANKSAGLPANFLWFPEGSAQDNLEIARYVAKGELEQLHTRYKTRIRKSWYTVPSVYTSEIGMLKRSHNAPRLILNKANAFTTDTAYRIKSLTIPASQLVASFVNPLTALSAELEGRTYGGGVLELVPSEIERLLIPVSDSITLDLDEIDAMIRQASMQDAIQFFGQRILHSIGLVDSEISMIYNAWTQLKNRRQRVSGPEE